MASVSHSRFVNKLAGARVLVLGGTSGIGFSVASAAWEHGASVIISGSKPEKVDSAVDRIRKGHPDSPYHSRIKGMPCNLASPETLEKNLTTLLNWSVTAFPEKESRSQSSPSGPLLDHIVFTAGDSIQTSTISDLTIDYIHKAGNVRFLGPLILAKLASSYMNHTTSSSITLTSGSQSQKPSSRWAVLVAYGCAVEGLTRSLAVELAPIRVNCVSPGAIHTELFNDIPADRLPGVLKGMAESCVLGSVGKPEEVAEAYLYTMKDRYCTGSLISSDGGRLLK